MSIDSSLKSSSSMAKHRNVLTRAERLAKLTEAGKIDMSKTSALALPKVANRKVAASKKSAKAEGDAAAGATPAAAAAPAAKAGAAKTGAKK